MRSVGHADAGAFEAAETARQTEAGGANASAAGGFEPGAVDSTAQPVSARQGATRRSIVLLPNIITTGALFAGFYATVAGMTGRFGAAAMAIFAAIALDTADGRVARFTRTQSNFGAQYDSLSDLVAFGVAPGLVLFFWGLSELGQVGWMCTFLYIACTALRLARFNTSGASSHFVGLPSPAAAALIACVIWVWNERMGGQPSLASAGVVAGIAVLAGLLMVSNFRYFSPKRLGLKGRVPFVAMVLVVLCFAVLLLDPPSVLLIAFIVYALSSPLTWVWRKLRHPDPSPN